jgi:lipoprotein-releasing system permease protein
VPGHFEYFVAKRYLRARRKEVVISVITVISVIGVAAGVMALIVALAINNGFHNTLQRNLLGAMADISVQAKGTEGIENWEDLAKKIAQVPHVTGVSPTLYSPIFLSGPLQSKGAFLKGVNLQAELRISDALRRLKQGSTAGLEPVEGQLPGIILGSRLAEDIGMPVNSRVSLVSPQGELTPIGVRPNIRSFRVIGIFESGFFEIDDSWCFTSLPSAQDALSLRDVINQIEIKTDNLDRVASISAAVQKVIGDKYIATTWLERNRQLMGALKMERVVTVVTIGLIELVAALNILITLIMMVMEKYRDIGILASMGASRRQIRNIFVVQGVMIGLVGTAIGLAVGYGLCYFADTYRWIRLDETVYSLSFVPFEPRWIDGIWVAGAAILVSFLATLYPARAATRISPAEVLRYE